MSRAVAAERVLTDNAADTIRGIGLVALSYAVLALGDASAKWAILSTGVARALMWPAGLYNLQRERLRRGQS